MPNRAGDLGGGWHVRADSESEAARDMRNRAWAYTSLHCPMLAVRNAGL